MPQPTTVSAAFVVPTSPNTDCAINGVADSAAIPPEIATLNYRYARNGEIYADFNSEFGILKAELDGGLFDVTSLTTYYHFKQTDNNNVSGESYPANFTQLADFDQFTQEVRFQSDFEGPFDILFGGFFSDSNFEFNTDAYILPFPPTDGSTFTSFKRDNGFDAKSFSIFGEATLALGEQIEISAGGRWSSEQRNSFQRSLVANPSIVVDVGGGTSSRHSRAVFQLRTSSPTPIFLLR